MLNNEPMKWGGLKYLFRLRKVFVSNVALECKYAEISMSLEQMQPIIPIEGTFAPKYSSLSFYHE